jgi:hypothetical protein
MDERAQLAASEIEAELLVALQNLPALHDIQSVIIRPYSGPKSWTWELDRIEPELGPPVEYADAATVVGRLQLEYDLDPRPECPATH